MLDGVSEIGGRVGVVRIRGKRLFDFLSLAWRASPEAIGMFHILAISGATWM